jgi:Tfp pilus assembly protein PilF
LPKALVGLAQALEIEANYRWTEAPAQQLQRAEEAMEKVLAASPDDATAHYVRGEILRASGRQAEAAVGEYETAIALNPSFAPLTTRSAAPRSAPAGR